MDLEDQNNPMRPMRDRSESVKTHKLWKEKLASIAARSDDEMADRKRSIVVKKAAEEVCQRINKARNLPVGLKQKLNAILEPSTVYDVEFAKWSKTVSRIINVTGFLAILISVCTILVESLPKYYRANNISFFLIETSCVAFFTLELILRFTSSEEKKAFSTDFLNVIDLLSILPYYLSLFLQDNSVASLTFLRAVRLVRVLRVFKLGKLSESLQFVQKSLARSLDALYLLFFLIMLSTVLFSSAMYLAETSNDTFENGTWYYTKEGVMVESQFQSIPHTFWWTLVTLFTVGYGDAVPQSDAGKIVAAVTMLCGILVVAFPVILIGANFNEIVAERQREQGKDRDLEDISELRIMANTAILTFARNLKRDHPEVTAGKCLSETTVTNFSCQERVYCVSEVKELDLRTSGLNRYLYRYNPICCVVPRSLVVVEGPHYLLSFGLVLDCYTAHNQAHTELINTGSLYQFSQAQNTGCHEVGYLKISIPGLDTIPDAHLLTTQYHNPPAVIRVTIVTRTEASLRSLKNTYLISLVLSVFTYVCSENESHSPQWKGQDASPNLVTTVPLDSLIDADS